jgi:hypothetical protein
MRLGSARRRRPLAQQSISRSVHVVEPGEAVVRMIGRSGRGIRHGRSHAVQREREIGRTRDGASRPAAPGSRTLSRPRGEAPGAARHTPSSRSAGGRCRQPSCCEAPSVGFPGGTGRRSRRQRRTDSGAQGSTPRPPFSRRRSGADDGVRRHSLTALLLRRRSSADR